MLNKIVFIIIVVIASFSVSADTSIYGGHFSTHIGGDYTNEEHTWIGVRHHFLTAGYMVNSFGADSVYGGVMFRGDHQGFGLDPSVGFVYGYGDGYTNPYTAEDGKTVLPYIPVRTRYDLTDNINVGVTFFGLAIIPTV